MSDSKKISILFAIIVILGFVVYKASRPSGVAQLEQEVIDQTEMEEMTGAPSTQAPAKVAQPLEPVVKNNSAVPMPPVPVSEAAAALQKTPLSEKEVKSVRQLSGLMVRLLTNKTSANNVSNMMKSVGLTPTKKVDANKYTGRMTIMRTENALDGTRYLHVQLVGNNEKDEGLQHASFQVRPGKDSFEKAGQMLKSSLPPGAKLKSQSANSVIYGTPDCMEMGVVRTESTDELAAHKENAFTADDIGTIIVYTEQDVHCGADDDGHGH